MSAFKTYEEARAEAQRLANEAARATPAYAAKGGCDWSVEHNKLMKEWVIRRLPLPQNRYGFELRVEVVEPEIHRYGLESVRFGDLVEVRVERTRFEEDGTMARVCGTFYGWLLDVWDGGAEIEGLRVVTNMDGTKESCMARIWISEVIDVVPASAFRRAQHEQGRTPTAMELTILERIK